MLINVTSKIITFKVRLLVYHKRMMKEQNQKLASGVWCLLHAYVHENFEQLDWLKRQTVSSLHNKEKCRSLTQFACPTIMVSLFKNKSFTQVSLFVSARVQVCFNEHFYGKKCIPFWKLLWWEQIAMYTYNLVWDHNQFVHQPPPPPSLLR